MSAPDDETPKPPIGESPTLPDLGETAVNDTEPPPPGGETEVQPTLQIIPSGWARYAYMAAVSDVQRALDMLIATGDAIARQLDGEP